ncbi:MAG: BatA and WFA domain-containing protein [Pirellulaceae bacterium]
MSPINMLNWWQWTIMAAVPPLIVMLYFLKLRRVPVAVPSTYLWKKTIEDLHVNSIWQRLRKNLLLLLQLLVVLLLALACLRPGFRGQESIGGRSIFMIDNSSSMQSTDVEVSRLAAAKREALRMIEGLRSGDVGMVLAFSDRADVQQGFTTDKRKLRAAVEAIQPTNRTTDLNEALRAAAGLANPGRTSQIEDINDIHVAEAVPASIYILSDGGFGPPQVDLGNLSAEYIAIGTEAPNNVGILAFTADRNLEKQDDVEAFARLQNFGIAPMTFNATLKLNDELVDASQVELAGGEAKGVSFSLNQVTEGRLTLELDVVDDFALDNRAFAGLDPPRELEVVLVTEGNTALEAALATPQVKSMALIRRIDPASLSTAENQQLATAGQVDLFIYDQCSPEKLPNANTLFLGAIPPGDQWQAGPSAGPLFIIDSNRSHPVMQYVDMGAVLIAEGQALTLPPSGTELLRTDRGILMAIAPREAYQDAVLSMPFVKRTESGATPTTNWPVLRSFPVFIFNALEYLGGAVSTASAKTIRPGQPAVLSLANRYEKIRIEGPSERKNIIERAGQPKLIYTQTEDLGFYQTKPADGERLLQLFTVNLFSERESNIAVAPDVEIGSVTVAANEARKDIVRVETWRWLLALALVGLCVEWYVYTRRIAV